MTGLLFGVLAAFGGLRRVEDEDQVRVDVPSTALTTGAEDVVTVTPPHVADVVHEPHVEVVTAISERIEQFEIQLPILETYQTPEELQITEEYFIAPGAGIVEEYRQWKEEEYVVKDPADAVLPVTYPTYEVLDWRDEYAKFKQEEYVAVPELPAVYTPPPRKYLYQERYDIR